jgi:hypothetical protein
MLCLGVAKVLFERAKPRDEETVKRTREIIRGWSGRENE